MFKGKIRIYKNIDGKEKTVTKEFNDEKKFNEFIAKNPELKSLDKWENIKWFESLFDVNSFFEEAKILDNKDIFKEMKKDLDKLVNKSKKLLGK